MAWDRAENIDTSIVKKLGSVGFLGLTVPEEYGGSGGDHLAYCLVTEELGRGDSSVRGIVSVSLGLVTKTIAAWGDEEQKRHWLPRLTMRRGDRLLRPHRARHRFGRREPDDEGRPGR